MIGGNITIQIQTKTITTNDIGEQVKSWQTVQSLVGYLDSNGGDAKYTPYNAKIQESSHIFICDYVSLDSRVKVENSRVLIPNKGVFDIMLIDNPMELNKQFEIYLKFVGGQIV